jgi:hypothetical protein
MPATLAAMPTPVYAPPPTMSRMSRMAIESCYRCRQSGHISQDFPLCYDIRHMTTNEKDMIEKIFGDHDAVWLPQQLRCNWKQRQSWSMRSAMRILSGPAGEQYAPAVDAQLIHLSTGRYNNRTCSLQNQKCKSHTSHLPTPHSQSTQLPSGLGVLITPHVCDNIQPWIEVTGYQHRA